MKETNRQVIEREIIKTQELHKCILCDKKNTDGIFHVNLNGKRKFICIKCVTGFFAVIIRDTFMMKHTHPDIEDERDKLLAKEAQKENKMRK